MGMTINTAARIYKGQKQGVSGEEGYLAWDTLPDMGFVKVINTREHVAHI